MIPYTYLEEQLSWIYELLNGPKQSDPPSIVIAAVNQSYSPDKDMVYNMLCSVNWGEISTAKAELPNGKDEMKALLQYISANYKGKANIEVLTGSEPDERRLANLRCSMVNNQYAHLGIIYGQQFLYCLEGWYKMRNDTKRLAILKQQTGLSKQWIEQYELKLYGYPFSK